MDQALASRTYAELIVVTSDLLVPPTAARPAATGPVSTPARTLAKAAARAGACMLAAFVITGVVVLINVEDMSTALALIAAVVAVIAASGFLGYGVIDAWHEHRSRGQLPPRPGRNGTGLDGKGLEGGRPGSDGRDPGWPGDHRDQTLFDWYTRQPRRGRRHASGTGARTRRCTRPVLDFL